MNAKALTAWLEGIEKEFPQPTRTLAPSSALQGLTRSNRCFRIFDPQYAIKREANPRTRAMKAFFLSFRKNQTQRGKKIRYALLVIKGITTSKTLFWRSLLIKKKRRVSIIGRPVEVFTHFLGFLRIFL